MVHEPVICSHLIGEWWLSSGWNRVPYFQTNPNRGPHHMDSLLKRPYLCFFGRLSHSGHPFIAINSIIPNHWNSVFDRPFSNNGRPTMERSGTSRAGCSPSRPGQSEAGDNWAAVGCEDWTSRCFSHSRLGAVDAAPCCSYQCYHATSCLKMRPLHWRPSHIYSNLGLSESRVPHNLMVH